MSDVTIQAIPTEYGKHLFRSRLEARWAMFFDEMGIAWEYEPEAYRLVIDGETVGYTPDFWLPSVDGGVWFEVKPGTSSPPESTPAVRKPSAFAAQVRARVYVAFGAPNRHDIGWWCDAPDSSFFGGGMCDYQYMFCECPNCGRITLQFSAAGGRHCNVEPEYGSSKRVSDALWKASAHHFWDPTPSPA